MVHSLAQCARIPFFTTTTTGVVLAALLAQWFNFPLDRIAAPVIVVAIGKTGWDLLSDGMRVLLDALLDADTLL